MVWSCFLFTRSGQNHLARHSERGKKTKQTKEKVGRQHQEMDRPGVRQVPEGSGEQGKMEKTGCKIICGAPTTLAVKGFMIIIMMVCMCVCVCLYVCVVCVFVCVWFVCLCVCVRSLVRAYMCVLIREHRLLGVDVILFEHFLTTVTHCQARVCD